MEYMQDSLTVCHRAIVHDIELRFALVYTLGQGK